MPWQLTPGLPDPMVLDPNTLLLPQVRMLLVNCLVALLLSRQI